MSCYLLYFVHYLQCVSQWLKQRNGFSERESSRRVCALGRNSGSSIMLLLITLLMLPWHTSMKVLRLISFKVKVECAPHLSETPDIFLWWFLKDNIYQDNARTVADLKTAITEKTQAITLEEYACVINNFLFNSIFN